MSTETLDLNQPRCVARLHRNWRFSRSAPLGAAGLRFNDSAWEVVRVPHDWAIRGPFDRENDCQRTTIVEDGETKTSEHTGRTGGLPHVGLGWYRKRFPLPEAARGRRVFVEFDGVMSHSVVYVNGRSVGSWPYGYASFCFEITGHVRFGEENVLAVRVENPPHASRWYPGAGIYRNVRLVLVHPVHVVHWGTYIATPHIADDQATVRVRTEVLNRSGQPAAVKLQTEIRDPSGKRVTAKSSKRTINEGMTFDQSLTVPNPQRWDMDTPRLYRALSRVFVDGQRVDEYVTPFGIREIRFDANEGVFLNGRPRRLLGVCQHHDLGALGSAVSRRALERQLEMLREMGCNAIRTSHNPPAPELLDLCDAMGFVVLDEAFDEWTVPKVDNGYHVLFNEWAEKDLTAMIRRDRNHPCVIMYSIGNEVGDMGRPDGAQVCRFLTDVCHREDPTRPVTAGFNNSDGAIANGLAAIVDVPGWNYKPRKYQQYHAEHPAWPTYGSETESCVSTRGEYYFPVEEERDKRRETLQVSSYDMTSPSWGYPPEYEFKAQDECPFIMGQFVWTGFDYLGEPTPYKSEWPSRSSYFGIIDLAGLPKDRFYLYRSKWSPKPTLHLLPHWNWAGREGEVTPVHCYTSYNAAELVLNGRSLGIRRKDPNTLFGRYRLIWDDVRYEPGVLKVVALDDAGQPAMEKEVRTAGAPARIELEPDRSQIRADGEDLSFVTARILDAAGNVCPLADNLVRFTLEGPGEIAGVDNGDPTSLESFVAPQRKAFHGLCMAILRSREGAGGELRLTASSDALAGATATVRAS
ncbi:MAG: DUF4982 domain-containing protein [Candidatus Sumerlaeota bacterium]|nr:DUF4982 domain-containing protein [Candidatus Sumerlaeota bacterium]